MTIQLTEDTRLILPRELMVGRLVIVATLGMLLLREISALSTLESDVVVALTSRCSSWSFAALP